MSERMPAGQWAGLYMDGQSAQAWPVFVQITPAGLRLRDRAGKSWLWSYEALQQLQGQQAGEHVRLEFGDGEALEIAAPGFLAAVREIAPSAKFRAPLAPKQQLIWVASCIVAIVVLIVGTYAWLIPQVAVLAATRVPISWEEQLGHSVVDGMSPPKDRVTDPKLLAAVSQLVALLAKASPSPYHYKVNIARNPVLNAFAAPGGEVVVFTGLLTKTTRPEELAGVLAHEMQHVQRRHTTRALLRQASLQLLISALTGDTGQASQALGVASGLGTLGYARADEAEADREGMHTLQAAHIDPQGMIAMFETLKRETETDGGLEQHLSFLSNHPSTADRIQVLQGLAKERSYKPIRLMSPHDWQALVKRFN